MVSVTLLLAIMQMTPFRIL